MPRHLLAIVRHLAEEVRTPTNDVRPEHVLHGCDDARVEQEVVDPAVLDTVGRMGGADYSTTRDRFAMPRPSDPNG